MSERKVLNKYYPPDFDPSKIPRVRQGKNHKFTVRLMAPCNMRCNTCGEYIYKGKKFNARKEDVENEDYLGLRIYRFYIKCTRCISEICFKTDPSSTDYIIEAGATRNFMALKLAEEQAEREAKAEEEDDRTNPMKVLEKRTQASRNEMAILEALEELKEMNQRHFTPDIETIINKFPKDVDQEQLESLKQEEEDEKFVRSIFGTEENPIVKRIDDESSSEDDEPKSKKSNFDFEKPTDVLTSESKPTSSSSFVKAKENTSLSIGSLKKGSILVKPKSSTPLPAKPVILQKDNHSSSSEQQKSGSLSLLGSYGSDSDESSN